MHKHLRSAAVRAATGPCYSDATAVGPTMIEIRIVCAHDAIPLAEMLTRLLEAEEHRVRLSFGRQALRDVEEISSVSGAVLLIWSPNARSQTYMIEWARKVEPARLIEIARDANDWPTIKRVSSVINFTNWRGQRGARCWKALTERIAAVTRTLTPQKPPIRALAAIGVAGLAAVTGAAVVRLQTTAPAQTASALTQELVSLDPASGIGGPLNAIEPASMEDGDLYLRPFPQLAPINAPLFEPLADLPDLDAPELRDPTLMERLSAYNPLRHDDERS